jgi:hypothetical protein
VFASGSQGVQARAQRRFEEIIPCWVLPVQRPLANADIGEDMVDRGLEAALLVETRQQGIQDFSVTELRRPSGKPRAGCLHL